MLEDYEFIIVWFLKFQARDYQLLNITLIIVILRELHAGENRIRV